MYVFVCVYVYVCVCMCLCVNMCVCVHCDMYVILMYAMKEEVLRLMHVANEVSQSLTVMSSGLYACIHALLSCV
jgi:hypothetical protein